MSNMSYCRFENTNNDLADCEDALEQMINDQTDELHLSDRELRAAQDLVARCLNIVTMIAEQTDKSLDDVMESHLHEAVDAINDRCTR